MSLHFSTSESPAELGGKGRALAELGLAGFQVPPWFAVPPDHEVGAEELAAALAKLGGRRFAVRSSAAAEDGAEHSFAGQFSTFLEVPAEGVAQRIAEVRASARDEGVLHYCTSRGIDPPTVPTVLVQRMIDAARAGVAFSADPVSGARRKALVSAVEGTGEKLVSGEADGQTWTVGREVEENAEGLLARSQVWAVARLARDCERHCGRPQDIEWAIDRQGELWLLQSRPITTLSGLPDPGDEVRVWDNSNIAESYGGVTSTLTFSFALRVYESVYREFCRLMSVPDSRIQGADAVFARMLGLVRGRVYYNLGNWYRVLALLPGFQLNRGFMEQMMGVREPLPDELVEQVVAESRRGCWSDALALLRTSAGLVARLVGLRRQVAGFYRRLEHALEVPSTPFHEMSGDELVAHYRSLEGRLLRSWDAPLVNDFFAMVFYGVLRSLCGRWAGDETGTLQNRLLAESGGIISAEPPRRIRRMAELASATPGLPARLLDASLAVRAKLAALRENDELAREFERYLTDFGDRCLEELKLESPTVRDDPGTLLTSIGAMAEARIPERSGELSDEAPSLEIENPPKRWVFHWVLAQTRERVRCRENLRFERTRVFGRVRTIVREMGKRLHADDRLDDPADVFHLEIGELLAVWEGTGTVDDLAALARQRRAEFKRHEREDAPPDRFTTRGPIHRYRSFEHRAADASADGGDLLQGVGACPGRVRGRVRVVSDPRGARLEPGEILVARQTDPGWVVLFPAASGLLVERGSLLSHSAIVSRELRLPCVVSLPGVTSRLTTGDRVVLDGSTGEVRIIGEEGDEPV